MDPKAAPARPHAPRTFQYIVVELYFIVWENDSGTNNSVCFFQDLHRIGQSTIVCIVSIRESKALWGSARALVGGRMEIAIHPPICTPPRLGNTGIGSDKHIITEGSWWL